MPITSRQVGRSAGEKLNIHLAGHVVGDPEAVDVVDPSEFDAKHVRVMTIIHSLQTGVVALLYWESTDGDHQFIMPIEGRGIMSFDRFDGLSNPKTDNMTGKLLVCINSPHDDTVRHFALSFELYKQRS